MFAVKRYVRQSNQWLAISHYNDDWGFIGSADHFSTKEDAQRYLEVCLERLNQRLGLYGKPRTPQRLKVFEETKDVKLVKQSNWHI